MTKVNYKTFLKKLKRGLNKQREIYNTVYSLPRRKLSQPKLAPKPTPLWTAATVLSHTQRRSTPLAWI